MCVSVHVRRIAMTAAVKHNNEVTNIQPQIWFIKFVFHMRNGTCMFCLRSKVHIKQLMLNLSKGLSAIPLLNWCFFRRIFSSWIESFAQKFYFIYVHVDFFGSSIWNLKNRNLMRSTHIDIYQLKKFHSNQTKK